MSARTKGAAVVERLASVEYQHSIMSPSQVCFVSYFLVTWTIAALILLLIFFDLEMLQMNTFNIQ